MKKTFLATGYWLLATRPKGATFTQLATLAIACAALALHFVDWPATHAQTPKSFNEYEFQMKDDVEIWFGGANSTETGDIGFRWNTSTSLLELVDSAGTVRMSWTTGGLNTTTFASSLIHRKGTTTAANVGFRFANDDAGGNVADSGRVQSRLTDATVGSVDGEIQLLVPINGSITNMASVDGSGVTTPGDVVAQGGDNNVGVTGTTRGVVRAFRGAGGNTPGTYFMESPNGTDYYLFIEDDGTLKVHTALPTANTDGSVVGGQS